MEISKKQEQEDRKANAFKFLDYINHEIKNGSFTLDDLIEEIYLSERPKKFSIQRIQTQEEILKELLTSWGVLTEKENA